MEELLTALPSLKVEEQEGGPHIPPKRDEQSTEQMDQGDHTMGHNRDPEMPLLIQIGELDQELEEQYIPLIPNT